MSREELLELASLDALGLLDEYEAALYTRSFHHAPAAVQDELKEFQATIVTDPALLPDVEPPAELRAIVGQAVSDAVEAESDQLAPLAAIGSSRLRQSPTTPARSGLSTGGHYWRAATFILASTVIALAYMLSDTVSNSNRIAGLALDNATSEQLEHEIGPLVSTFQKTGGTIIALTGNGATPANIWMNDTDVILITLQNVDLPPVGAIDVQLTASIDGGPAITVHEFSVNKQVTAETVKLTGRFAKFAGPGVTWEISSVDDASIRLTGVA